MVTFVRKPGRVKKFKRKKKVSRNNGLWFIRESTSLFRKGFLLLRRDSTSLLGEGYSFIQEITSLFRKGFSLLRDGSSFIRESISLFGDAFSL